MLTRTAALALTPALLLTACGDYEDASAEAQADTVEIPADAPLQNVTATPVADPNANTDVAVDPVATGTPAAGATPAATVTASPSPTGTASPAATGTAAPASPAASPSPRTPAPAQ